MRVPLAEDVSADLPGRWWGMAPEEEELEPVATSFGPTTLACVAYTDRMTQTLSFRAETSLAEELDAAAVEAGVPRSDLLNQAVREFLYRLRCERDAERYALHPLTAAETAAWPNEAWPDDDTDWTEVFSQ